MSRGDIGFVGLGIMGKPMVRNLLKADYNVTVFDIVAREAADEGIASAGRINRFDRYRINMDCVVIAIDQKRAIAAPCHNYGFDTTCDQASCGGFGIGQ